MLSCACTALRVRDRCSFDRCRFFNHARQPGRVQTFALSKERKGTSRALSSRRKRLRQRRGIGIVALQEECSDPRNECFSKHLEPCARADLSKFKLNHVLLLLQNEEDVFREQTKRQVQSGVALSIVHDKADNWLRSIQSTVSAHDPTPLQNSSLRLRFRNLREGTLLCCLLHGLVFCSCLGSCDCSRRDNFLRFLRTFMLCVFLYVAPTTFNTWHAQVSRDLFQATMRNVILRSTATQDVTFIRMKGFSR